MTDERIEFVDEDYGQVQRISPARQIKTRILSFNNIREKFRQFRIRRLEKKLDKTVEKALTQNYTNENYDRKITKNANAIARLEEKIMVLSREDVPTNYVARRAIKLRKSMIDNLTYNTGAFYSVGLDNRDEVMGTGIVEEQPEVKVVEEPMPYEEKVIPFDDENYNKRKEELAAAIPAGKEGSINIASDNLDRQTIEDIVNSSFEDAKEKVDEDKPQIIGTADVRDVINDSLDGISDDKVVIDKEVVRKAVDEAFSRMEEEKKAATDTSIKENVDREIERIRVSRNNTKAVDPAQFDEDGYRRPRRKKYNYTPMTDEEIRASQIKLGFDEHGNLVDTGRTKPVDIISKARVVDPFVAPTITLDDVFVPAKESLVQPTRDIPVVVKDRDEATLDLDLDDENDNMFEVIKDVEEEKKDEVSIPEKTEEYTSDDYTAIKERIMYLLQLEADTKRQKAEAERRAQEAAERAQEARRMYEVSQANYNERLQKLRAYAASLEAACSENTRGIEEAERELKENDEFVQAQKDKAERTNKIISEMDLMMSDRQESTETRIAIR